MRDLIVTMVTLGLTPVVVMQPHVGVLVWCWISFMNPHRLTWGFANDVPFAMIIALGTVGAWIVSREPKRIPITPVTLLLLLFIALFTVSTVYSLVPELSWEKWELTIKIFAFVFITCALMNKPTRIQALVWVCVLSIGYYGVKGGGFSIITGGQHIVYGPSRTMIEDNNHLSLALLMTMPLMVYLYKTSRNRLVRWGLIAALALTAVAIVGSYSRGAIVGVGAMAGYLWLHTRHKIVTSCLAIILVLGAVSLAPGGWQERIASISEWKQDPSATGRIDAWIYAWNVAVDRPLLGGGFNSTADKETFFKYSPDSEIERAAHSIYFEVLGEHGFPALVVFLAIGLFTWRNCNWIIKNSRDLQQFRWAYELANMVKLSIVSYAVAGAFLSLAYYDFYFALVATMVATRRLLEQDARHGRQISWVERQKQMQVNTPVWVTPKPV